MRGKNSKQIIKIILLFTIGIGQFSFFVASQSRDIWPWDIPSGEWDYDSQKYIGNFEMNVPPNPLGFNRYCIEKCVYFVYLGDRASGSITFRHIETNQEFYFSYYLGEGSYQGEDCESTFWFLPPGDYFIEWLGNSWHPSYKLFATSIFYPADMLVIVISGFITFILIVVAIKQIVQLSKGKSNKSWQYYKTYSHDTSFKAPQPKSIVYCKRCGTIITKDYMFCTKCGNRLDR